MSLTNPKDVVTEERLSEFYQAILPYLGGMPDVLANKFAKGDMFSTSEKMIGQWTDGKPLYQKVLNYTNIVVDKTTTTLENLAALSIDSCASITAVAETTAGSYSFPEANVTLYIDASDNLKISIPSQKWNFTTLDVFVKYTKTSDSAVAIGDETDYSTTEKIVGTWIDGSPIYQKTIDIGTLPNNTTKTVAHEITNLDFVISAKGSGYRSSDGLINIFPDAPGVDIWLNATNINIKTNSDKSGYTKAYVTLQYTKTPSV